LLGYAAIHNPFANFIQYPPQSPPQTLWLFKALLKLGFHRIFGIHLPIYAKPNVVLLMALILIDLYILTLRKIGLLSVESLAARFMVRI
jgi:hypothetical protein